jgi:hypothetical protein
MAANYVQNGQGYGPVGSALNVHSRLTGGFDAGLLRPFFETDPNSPDVGRPCAQLRVGTAYNSKTGHYEARYEKRSIDEWARRGVYSPVFNAVALTREDWVEVDRAILRATRLPLTAYGDLRAANTRGGFDAWGKYTLEYSAAGDAGEVVKDMDATSAGRNDLPSNLTRSIPLPVIHGDVDLPQRYIDMTRGGGMPIDVEMVEQLTRRGWEMVEKTLIGTETGVTWGGRTTGPFPHTGTSTEWGYTTFPYRVTKTDLTTPLGSNPEAVNQDVMEMLETMYTNGFQGPFVLYHSTPYSLYLNSDYFRSGGTSANTTTRARIMDNEGITAIRRLDYLTSGYQLILVDLNRGDFQAIDGMAPRAVQWSERGGTIQKIMVMMIQVALLKARSNGVAPLIHATTS